MCGVGGGDVGSVCVWVEGVWVWEMCGVCAWNIL